MTNFGWPILIPSNGGGTQPLNAETRGKLRECDRVEYWMECGWQCATGYKGDDIHVFVHANSIAEIALAQGTNLGDQDQKTSRSRFWGDDR